MSITATPPGLSVRERLSGLDQGYIIAFATVILLVFGGIFVDGMLSVGNLSSVATLSAPLAILAIASALVIIGKNIDVSVVAVVGVAAMSMVQLQTERGWGEIQTLVLVALVALGVGLVNGWLVAYVGVPALFVTLGTWKMFEGLFNWTLLEGTIFFPLPRDATLVRSLGRSDVLGISVPILVAAIVVVLAWVVLNRTTYGRLLRAMGDTPAAARLSGIPVRPLVVSTFVAAALLAAVAGVLYLAVNGSYTRTNAPGEQVMFSAITAAVIGGVSLSGGRGSLFGVLAGTAFIAVFVNLMTLMDFGIVASSAIRGVLLLAALAFDAWLHPRDEETARSDEL